jgi:hypothetical protein
MTLKYIQKVVVYPGADLHESCQSYSWFQKKTGTEI